MAIALGFSTECEVRDLWRDGFANENADKGDGEHAMVLFRIAHRWTARQNVSVAHSKQSWSKTLDFGG